jgi:predicted SprT family Zn-dependent metalloprotease
MSPGLQPEHASALVRELLAAHRQLNQSHFKGALSTPQLSLSTATTFLARWLPAVRTIEVSASFLEHAASWGVVLEVLKHEMAHQYVHEVLRENETAHGPAFRAVCERLGIDARASGIPEATLDAAATRVLERVHKLLALAESDNRHEAEAAAAAAQRLMLRHNLEHVVEPRDEQARYGFRHLGRVTGRVTEWERRLGNVLREHFFVDIIWVPAYQPLTQKRGSVMEAIGTRENLDLSAYVYDFLVRTAERLWQAHRSERGIGNAARRAYLAGVMSGFAQKLAQQAKVHKAEGLVWVPRAELVGYTRKRHPYLRTISHRGHSQRDVFAHGQKAGRELVLHKGVSSQGVGGVTKLLRG